jgi:hypothetical protein
MRSLTHTRAFLGLAAASLIVAACSKDSSGPDTRFPAGVAAFSGDAQVAAPSTPLPDPLTVKVFDDQGSPFAGVVVTWTVTAGGGTLDVTSSTTGDDGTASAHLTLGPNPGDNVVTASIPNLQTITFTATAEPPLAPPAH